MTQEEADKIASVLSEVDGQCPVCVNGACEGMNEAELGFTFTLEKEYSHNGVVAKPNQLTP